MSERAAPFTQSAVAWNDVQRLLPDDAAKLLKSDSTIAVERSDELQKFIDDRLEKYCLGKYPGLRDRQGRMSKAGFATLTNESRTVTINMKNRI